MVRLRIRHVTEHWRRRPDGTRYFAGFYYQATPAMRAAGILSESLGRDRAAAVARAEALNASWDAARAGQDPAPPPMPGTFAWAVAALRGSAEWADKAPRTRADYDAILPAIEAHFGDIQLRAITPLHCQDYYDGLREKGSVHAAAKRFRALRYVLNYAARMGWIPYPPTRGVRMKTPPARRQRWRAADVWPVIRAAWRGGQPEIAVLVAIAYDTGLRPGDIRRLTQADLAGWRIRIAQAKTGQAVQCTLWPETRRLVKLYLARRRAAGLELLPGTPLLRGPRGGPLSATELSRRARVVMRAAGLDESLRLADLRRTASSERAEAGASAAELAAGGGWSIGRGAQILDTYNPATAALAEAAQAKRRAARRQASESKSLKSTGPEV